MHEKAIAVPAIEMMTAASKGGRTGIYRPISPVWTSIVENKARAVAVTSVTRKVTRIYSL